MCMCGGGRVESGNSDFCAFLIIYHKKVNEFIYKIEPFLMHVFGYKQQVLH